MRFLKQVKKRYKMSIFSPLVLQIPVPEIVYELILYELFGSRRRTFETWNLFNRCENLEVKRVVFHPHFYGRRFS